MYVTGNIPIDFTNATMVAIPKKHNSQTCEEHRTLSILLYTLKFLTRIVYRRIENKIESNSPDDQFGFRKGKGTQGTIMSLRLIVE